LAEDLSASLPSFSRNPDYRESWNSKQKKLTEGAFPAILNEQVEAATAYNDVYFKDVATGQWVETDSVGVMDDTQELPDVVPILGRFPFISMSIDDLFVLKRFLTSTGTLFHYLTVRQQVAGIKDAMMFDEQDHLGAYVSRNRFDQDMAEQLKKADMVSWDGFSDKISDYFSQVDWEKNAVPQQAFPAELAEILAGLDSSRSKGWLEFDAHLRDLSGNSRENLASVVRDMRLSLSHHPVRSFLFDGQSPLQVFVHVDDQSIPVAEVTHRGEVACLIAEKQEVLVLVLGYANSRLASVKATKIHSPPIIRADYDALVSEANTKRKKYAGLGNARKRKPKERLSKRAKRRMRHKK
jgi:hypothetical protein